MTTLILNMINIQKIDFRKWAVVSLLCLWASTTFSIALMEIAFVCALICWIGRRVQTRRVLKKAGSIDWALWVPLALFFITVLISFFTSEYPKQSFRGLLKIAKPLLTFLMVADLFRDEKAQHRYDLAFLMTFLVVTIDSTIQYAFGRDLLRFIPPEASGSGLRVVGPFGNFAKMAAYLVLVIPVFGMRFWNDLTLAGNRRRSIYALALMIAGVTLLYLTRCRGPVVAVALSFLLVIIYKRWFKALAVMTILGLALLAMVPRNVFIHRDSQGKEQSINERFYLWRRAVDVIAARPLTGTGINTYDKAHAKYDTLRQKKYMPISGTSIDIRQNPNGSVSFKVGDTFYTSDEKQKFILIGKKNYSIHRDAKGDYFIWDDLVARGYYAHNGYLQLTAEIGLPGIFFFLLFLFMLFKKAIGSLKSVRGTSEEYARLGLITGLLAFLLYAAADNGLQSPPSLMFFWYSAGVLLARLNRHSETGECPAKNLNTDPSPSTGLRMTNGN